MRPREPEPLVSAIMVSRLRVHICVPHPPMKRYRSSASKEPAEAVRKAAKAVIAGPRMRMRRRPILSSM